MRLPLFIFYVSIEIIPASVWYHGMCSNQVDIGAVISLSQQLASSGEPVDIYPNGFEQRVKNGPLYDKLVV